MRTIRRTTQFKKDYKSEKKSNRHNRLDQNLLTTVKLLESDKTLPRRNYDHALRKQGIQPQTNSTRSVLPYSSHMNVGCMSRLRLHLWVNSGSRILRRCNARKLANSL